MLTLNMVLHALRDHILPPGPPPSATAFRQFRMLDMDAPPFSREDVLYLATPGALCAVADRTQPASSAGFTVLVAGDSPSLAPYRTWDWMRLIVVDLSLTALCNRLLDVEHAYDTWTGAMESRLSGLPDLAGLVAEGASFLGADLLLLNEGYRILAESRQAGCPALEELQAEGGAPFDGSAFPPDGGWVHRGQWYLSLAPIRLQEQLAGYLLSALPEAQMDPCAQEWSGQVVQYVSRFLRQHHQEIYDANSRLSLFVRDLIEGRLTDPDHLVEQVKRLPIQLQRYYCLIVVEPDDPQPPISPHLISGLSQLFPLGIIVPYQGDILILAQKSRYTAPLRYDRDQLSRLLDRYQAVACVGNFTQWISALRPLYLQTKGCIPYARHFRTDPGRRLFRFEEYSMYQIVDLCARYCQDFHHNDLIYLSHPGVVALRKHDDARGTNYCLILKRYLMNERNQSQTAKEFFYHRNTLQSKIAKIQTIVGDDLEDPYIRQRLLFSLLVVDYMRTYLKQTDIYGVKRYHPATAQLVGDGMGPAAGR